MKRLGLLVSLAFLSVIKPSIVRNGQPYARCYCLPTMRSQKYLDQEKNMHYKNILLALDGINWGIISFMI